MTKRRKGDAAGRVKRRPPHLRKTASNTKNCHTCKSMNRTTGECVKYHYMVKRDETCDKWSPRK